MSQTKTVKVSAYGTSYRSSGTEWMSQATCIGMDPEDFFPDGRGHTTATVRAHEACLICPVRPNCLMWSTDSTHGIWAGVRKAS